MKKGIKNLLLTGASLFLSFAVISCDSIFPLFPSSESGESKESSISGKSSEDSKPSSSGKQKTMTGIVISQMPYQTTFMEGETLDIDGLKISITYDDGTREETTDYEISLLEKALTRRDTRVTIDYRGYTTTYQIEVLSASTEALVSEQIYLKKESDKIYLCVEGTQYGHSKQELESEARLYLENHGTYDGTNTWDIIYPSGTSGEATVTTGHFVMKYRVDDKPEITETGNKRFITHFSKIYTATSSKSTVFGNCRIPIAEDSYVYEYDDLKMSLFVSGDTTWSIPTILVEFKNQPGPGGDDIPAGGIHSSADEAIVKDDPNKLYLGDYGDYVEWVDKSKSIDLLRETYNNLISTEVQSIDQIFELAYQKGLLEFFDIKNKIEFDFRITNTELNKLNQDNSTGNRESYRIGDLDITMLGMKIHFKEVGIRQKGNTSRGPILSGNMINVRHYKMRFDETFDDEFTDTPMYFNNEAAKKYRKKRTLFGLEKIDLRRNRTTDLTYLREYYAYEGFRANGGISSRSNLLSLYWSLDDGSKQNMGVYLGVECIDKSFLERNFTEQYETGDLYKVGYGAYFNGFNASEYGVETLHKSGNSYWNSGFKFDLKTNKKTSQHLAIKEWVEGLNRQNSSSIYDFVNTYSDYQSFLTWLALAYLNGDQDDLRGNTNNTYVYMVPGLNKALFMPQDNDQSLGAAERDGSGINATGHHGARNNPFDTNTGHGNSSNVVILQKTIYDTRSTQIRTDYLNKINHVLSVNKWFKPETFRVYYDYAYNNYHNDTTLGNRVSGYNNVFSFTADTNVATRNPLDISVYMTTKESTFYTWCNNNNVHF